MSRTPVREALQQLVHEGLVQVIPGRGAFVASPSLEEVLSVLHLRTLIEPEIARLAAHARTDRLLGQLQALIESMEEAASSGDAAVWRDADLQLHVALAEACPNQLLGELAQQMRTRIEAVDLAAAVHPSTLLSRTRQQRSLVEAIAGGDGAAAAAASMDHLENFRAGLASRFI